MSEKERQQSQSPDVDAQEAAEQEMEGQQSVEENSGELSLAEALEKLARAEQLVVTQQDEVLRVRAEMQNLRRRTEKDVEKAHKFALERFATELLSVIDNLERALEAVGDREQPAVKPICEGIELTLKGFMDVLRKFNIEQIDPQGVPFDPQQHEAMTTQPNPDVEANTVLAVMQKGYSLHGRVIRPARVVVSRSE
jgi:molecular chaperone GrpE